MNGLEEHDTDIFDLGDDDDDDDDGRPFESSNPIAGADIMRKVPLLSQDGIGTAEREEGEEVMGNDPYNPDDWGDTLDGEGIEAAETSALLFDGADEQGHGRATADNNFDDLDSLMGRGLEEVDDLLSSKGRLGIVNPTQAPPEESIAQTGLSPGGSSKDGLLVATGDGTTAPAGGRREPPERNFGKLAPEFPQNPEMIDTARGAGAHAASVLASATAPAGSFGASVGVAPSPSHTKSMKQALGNASIAAVSNGEDDAELCGVDGEAQLSHEADEVARRQVGVRSYHYEAGADGGVDGTNLCSPPRRRGARDTAPFIQVKGLTLTYTQAKLFGLAANYSRNGDDAGGATWPVSGSRRPKSTCIMRGTGTMTGEARGGRRGPRLHQHRTYSPSRIEHLAQPVPRSGRIGDSAAARECEASNGWRCQEVGRERGGRGGAASAGGGEPTFTWKRSRRAEAAMRDPACGYDFVRDEGYNNKEDFLGRVEAYSSYSRQKLETQRGEDQYAARVDKLECPRCQNTQSYDEFVSKKLKCGGCDVAYCMPRTWNRRIWDQRNKICAAKSEERRVRVEQEAANELRKRAPKQTRHAALLRQRVGQVGFIRRMRDDLRRRRAREGWSKRQGNQDGEDGRVSDDQRQGDVIRRPASAPLTTDRRSPTAASTVDGAIHSPQLKKRATSGGESRGDVRIQGG